MAVCMAIGMSFNAFGAAEKIDQVKLSFRYPGEAPASGDAIGSIQVSSGGAGYRVDSAEYTNLETSEVWTVGDVPEVKLELSALDGYRFSYTSSGHFDISGCNAKFERAKLYDSGDTMELYVELKRIGGKLEGATGLEWNDTTAQWEEIEGAKRYDVKLLRDEKTVTTVSASGTSYNFAGYFNHEGDYTFRVRAVASYNNKNGEWSEDSDSYYVDEEEAGQYGGSGQWMQDGGGTWYAYSTGGYPAGCWKQINGVWYRFDNNGYLLRGWQKIDGQWYYMDPASGVRMTGWQAVNGQWYYLNGSGEMQTGWQAVNGQWYYLNGNGAMTTGWQAIQGTWYYMGGNGAMYANAMTPDGHYVNGSGAMIW